MTKFGEVARIVFECGFKAGLALLITEGIFVGFAIIAGLVALMLTNVGTGLIGAAAAFFLLNLLALQNVFEAVFAKIGGGAKDSFGE